MTATAAILTIGDELLLGDRVDTNGPWLSKSLLACGVEPIDRRCVFDDVDAIVLAIQELTAKSDVCILTGGLGPTEDDRTRLALALAMGEQLVHDAEAHQSIKAWFATRDASMPTANDSQAMRPESASWIVNKNGTAPGLIGKVDGCIVLCLPGPPVELQPMFQQVKDELLAVIDCGTPKVTIELHSWGMPESIAGEKIADLMQLEDPTVAILMGRGGITARVTSSNDDKISKVVKEIKQRWDPWVYGDGETKLAASIGTIIKGSIATAESCTTGLVAELIGQIPGASDWFCGGWVVYSNELKKSQLGVSSNLIEEHGAVSWQVAKAMSEGAVHKSGANVGISTTGIAGPSGGTEDKPVGTVFIGCTLNSETQIRKFRFSGNRDEIRRRAAMTALQMLRLLLKGELHEIMCWQHGETIQ